jgi:hypothetical protein
MLPLTIEMPDHLRQEKTGHLPSDLPPVPRQVEFRNGILGLWSGDHFIAAKAAFRNEVSILDRPGSVMIRIERSEQTRSRQKSHPFPMSPRIHGGDGCPLSDSCIQAMDDYFGSAQRPITLDAFRIGDVEPALLQRSGIDGAFLSIRGVADVQSIVR